MRNFIFISIFFFSLAINVPLACAHTFPMITVDPNQLSFGETLTARAVGMPGDGRYTLSIESESNIIVLGSVEIAPGEEEFTTEFMLPPAALPGNYIVKAVRESDNRAFYSLSEFTVSASQQSATSSTEAALLPKTLTRVELATITVILALAALGGAVIVRAK